MAVYRELSLNEQELAAGIWVLSGSRALMWDIPGRIAGSLPISVHVKTLQKGPTFQSARLYSCPPP